MEDRVEQFAAIRHDARVEGLSIRELASKYRVHRRTVRQALANAASSRCDWGARWCAGCGRVVQMTYVVRT